MNYEQWHEHTTELQNRYGYTGRPKPDGAHAKTSVYEFVNDWLPTQLAWLIFSYAAEPHVPKQVIADHYNGIGQRTFHTYPKPKWARRTGSYTLATAYTAHTGSRCESVITPESRLMAARQFNRNRVVRFLHETRKHMTGRVFVRDKKGKRIPKCTVLKALQDNKVKGRTQLYKNYKKLERLTDEEREAIFDSVSWQTNMVDVLQKL